MIKNQYDTVHTRSMFLQQSYIDSWQDYQYLLSHSRPARWDYFVITASNCEQARSYEMQLDYRLKNGWLPAGTKYLVIPDPDGKRVGSGGATLNVLRHIVEQSGEEDPFTGRRILVLHSGGDSKRVPQYSACGKLFSRVPRELPDGRCSTLFDEFVIALSGVPSRMSDGLMVMSGDVLLLFNPLQIDLQREGSACISIKAPVEVGEHHGVFLPGENGCVKGFLHKQPEVLLRAAGAINEHGYVDIDTGAIWMSSSVVKNIFSLIKEQGRICESLFLKYVNDKVRLSFYGDFVYPMVTDATLNDFLREPAEGTFCDELEDCRRSLWEVLHPYPMHMIRLSPAEFIHFGTTQELRELMLTACDRYKYLGWDCNVMSVGDSSAARINCVLEQGAEAADDAYLEDSHIFSGSVIGPGCVLSGTRFSGRLPPDTVLHVLPVKLPDSTGFVARIYGVEDNPKNGLSNHGSFLGTTLDDFVDKSGISEEQLWKSRDRSLWNAQLYPVCTSEAEAVSAALVIQRIVEERASGAEISVWRSSRRMSLCESFEAADMGRIMESQGELEDMVRTARFTKAITNGTWVRDAAGILGSGSALVRRMQRAVRAAEESVFSDRFRLLRALSEISRQNHIAEEYLSPDTLEDRSYHTINSAIREVTCDIPYSGNANGLLDAVDVELPVRVNWGGGWSDTPPYCLEHGGTVLNAAIALKGKLPVKVKVRRLEKPAIILESRDLKLCREFNSEVELNSCDNPSDPFALHKAALIVSGIIPQGRQGISLEKHLESMGGGVYLCTDVDVPKGSGLGTSSILAGAAAKALELAMGRPDDSQRLFGQVLCMEQLMTTGGGWQDQVGGLVPGIKLIRSKPGIQQDIEVQPMKLDRKVMQELDERFALIYTGQRRLARNLLREIMSKYILNHPDTLEILGRIQHIAVLMRFELEKGNIDGFAALLNEHWQLSKKLDAGSSNTCIDQIIHAVRPLIDGVFITGAGGGGFLQVILKKGIGKQELKKVLNRVFQDSGVETWDCSFVWE